MDSIVYSIIIPHHNCPEKLKRCLNSIPKRSDIEIIIVDDNSSQNIVDFSTFPGSGRSNVFVIKTNEGGGAGYARNKGMEMARGKWLVFSDADDEFYTDILSLAMDRHKDSSSDIIYFNVDVVNSETLIVENTRLKIDQHISTAKQSDIEWLRYNLTVPWGKFIKKKLVDMYHIVFDEVIAGNDVMFSLKTGHFAKKVIIDNIKIYKWYYHKFGNITSMITRESADSKFGVALRRLKFLSEHNKLMHRSNLFIGYVPFYKRTGLSFLYSYYIVFKQIPLRYRFIDTIGFIIFFLKKILNK